MSEISALTNSLAQSMNSSQEAAENIDDAFDSALIAVKEMAAKSNAMLAKANADALIFASVPAENSPSVEQYAELL